MFSDVLHTCKKAITINCNFTIPVSYLNTNIIFQTSNILVISIYQQRHGGFVWDEFPPSEVAKMLQYFGYNADKEVQTSNENNAPKNKATQASTTNEINNNTENSSTKQTQPLSMQHAGDGLPPVCN